MPDILYTNGMENVEDTFTKDSGSGTHTAGAATDKGATTNTSKETPSTTVMRTQSHQERFGDQYRPVCYLPRCGVTRMGS